jgi:hypothetical protein
VFGLVVVIILGVPLLRRVATLRASLRSVLRTLRPSRRLTQKLSARGQNTEKIFFKKNKKTCRIKNIPYICTVLAEKKPSERIFAQRQSIEDLCRIAKILDKTSK